MKDVSEGLVSQSFSEKWVYCDFTIFEKNKIRNKLLNKLDHSWKVLLFKNVFILNKRLNEILEQWRAIFCRRFSWLYSFPLGAFSGMCFWELKILEQLFRLRAKYIRNTINRGYVRFLLLLSNVTSNRGTTQISLAHSSGLQRSKAGRWACSLPEALRQNLFPCLSQFLEDVYIPRLTVTAPVFQGVTWHL